MCAHQLTFATHTASLRKDMPFRELGNLMSSNIGNLALGNRNGMIVQSLKYSILSISSELR